MFCLSEGIVFSPVIQVGVQLRTVKSTQVIKSSTTKPPAQSCQQQNNTSALPIIRRRSSSHSIHQSFPLSSLFFPFPFPFNSSVLDLPPISGRGHLGQLSSTFTDAQISPVLQRRRVMAAEAHWLASTMSVWPQGCVWAKYLHMIGTS